MIKHNIFVWFVKNLHFKIKTYDEVFYEKDILIKYFSSKKNPTIFQIFHQIECLTSQHAIGRWLVIDMVEIISSYTGNTELYNKL